MPPRSVAHDGPTYERPVRPARTGRTRCRPTRAEALPRPTSGDELRDTAAAPGRTRPTSPTSRGSPTSTTATSRATPCSPSPRTPASSGSTSESHLGVAVSTDCNGRFAQLDPYAGAQLALAESYRNVAVTGALPLAVTDCLNFGSPEDPDVMWQFEQATHGLKDACAVLGIPVTGGNVSFYNQTGETPDPAHARRRRARRHRRRPRSASRRASPPRASTCSCSARPARSCQRLHLGRRRPRPPRRSSAGRRPRRRAGARRRSCVEAATTRLLVEPPTTSPTVVSRWRSSRRRSATASASTSSSTTRSSSCSASPRRGRSWSSPRTATTSSSTLAEKHGVELASIGRTGGDALEVAGPVPVPVAELRADWQATLPAVLGPHAAA